MLATYLLLLVCAAAGDAYTGTLSFILSQSASGDSEARSLLEQVNDQNLIQTQLNCCDWMPNNSSMNINICSTQLPPCLTAMKDFLQTQYQAIAYVLWGLLVVYFFAIVAGVVLIILLGKRKEQIVDKV